MFLFDFAIENVMEYIIEWLYQQMIAVLGEFFAMMNRMGVELFDLPWAKSIMSFFQGIAWTLFIAGIVVAVFEYAIQYQSGRGDLKGSALNVLKGYFAVTLFTVLPVQVYALAVNMQSSVTWQMAGIVDVNSGFGFLPLDALDELTKMINPILSIFILIMLGYCVIKVFFSSLKRGGILLIQIAVGSLYMFSVPRGYTDGFYMWVKQVIATCLTALLQSVLLATGLIIFRDNMIMGFGVMLSAGEIPRIAGAFGLETGTRANIQGAVYTAQSAVNIAKTIKAAA